MSSESVNIRIGNLSLELPFRSRAHGRALVDRITRELGRMPALRAPRGPARLGRLRVDLPALPPRASDAQIARLVAAGVHRALDQAMASARRHGTADGAAPPRAVIDLGEAGAAKGERSRARRGAPLPAATRSFMEQRLGHRFDDVRVHSDDHAAALAGQRGDRAVTVGEDVFFGAGDYRPEAPEGRELLAHELTHVAQHDAAGPPAPTEALEAEAGAAAAAVAAGRTAPVRRAAAPGTPLGAPRKREKDRPEHDGKKRQPAIEVVGFDENPRKILAKLRTYRLTPRVNEMIDGLRRTPFKNYQTEIVVQGIRFGIVASIAPASAMTMPLEEVRPGRVKVEIFVDVPNMGEVTMEEGQTYVAQKLLHELDHASHRIAEWLIYKGVRETPTSPETQDLMRWRRMVNSTDVSNERLALLKAIFNLDAKLNHGKIDPKQAERALYWMAEEHAVSKTAAKVSGEVGNKGRPVDNALIAERYAFLLFDRAGGHVENVDKMKLLIAPLKAFLDALDRVAGPQNVAPQPPNPKTKK